MEDDCLRRTRFTGGVLNLIEKAGNRLPDPLVLFFWMALAVPLVSALAAWWGWSRVHPVSGETVQVVNLMTAEGFRRMLSSAVTNFTAFPPLGVVLVAMMGIGLAERSGLIANCLRSFIAVVPRSLVTASLVFAGVMSNLAVDAGYVVLVPLGAVLFASVGRHPVAGLCAAFAGVSGGFSANLVLSSVDPLLSKFTDAAAKLYDPAAVVESTGNYYFLFVSTFVVVFAGWWVTEKVVEPRLGVWKGSIRGDGEKEAGDDPKAMRAALGFMVLFPLLVAPMVMMEGGWLRDPVDLQNPLKPIYDALIPLLAIWFGVPGLIYGKLTGRIRNGAQMAGMLTETMAGMGSYLVLAFFAAQFIAYFQWSNLGLVTALTGAEALRASGAPPMVILLGVILLTAGVNLFIGSASAKWGLMAPVLVPMMMSLGFSPELAQVAFRIGDSTTNIITPLLSYFPMILIFAQRYLPEMKIGTLISLMFPYTLAFLISWSLQLVIWYFAGWPLGPGAGLEWPR